MFYLKAADKKRRTIAFLGIFIAIISSIIAIQNALQYSVDFQWSPTVAFWKGVNPYLVSISNQRDKYIILSQDPNYLHGLYILFFPFSKLEFQSAKLVWSLINIGLGIGSVILIGKMFKLAKFEVLICGIIFICSSAFTNCIGNGQHTLMTLFFLLLFLKTKSTFKPFYQFVFFLKYSFAPVFFLYSLFKREKSLLISSLMLVAAALVFAIIANSNVDINLFFLPLNVAENKTSFGFADLYSLLKAYANTPFFVNIGISIAISMTIAFYLTRSENKYTITILSMASLLLFYHLIYDYIFLLPALAQLIVDRKKLSSKTKFLMIAVVFYFLYFYKILFINNFQQNYFFKIFGFLLLTTTLIALLIEGREKRPSISKKID